MGYNTMQKLNTIKDENSMLKTEIENLRINLQKGLKID